MSGRSSHATAILGPELAAKLPEVKVLLVGAGGIGCEVCEYPLYPGELWRGLGLAGCLIDANMPS